MKHRNYGLCGDIIIVIGLAVSVVASLQIPEQSENILFAWPIFLVCAFFSVVSGLLISALGEIIENQIAARQNSENAPFSVHIPDEALNGNYERKESQEFEPGFDQEYDPEIDIEDDSSLHT